MNPVEGREWALTVKLWALAENTCGLGVAELRYACSTLRFVIVHIGVHHLIFTYAPSLISHRFREYGAVTAQCVSLPLSLSVALTLLLPLDSYVLHPYLHLFLSASSHILSLALSLPVCVVWGLQFCTE